MFELFLIYEHCDQAINQGELRITNTRKPGFKLFLHLVSGVLIFIFHHTLVELFDLRFHILFMFIIK
jgi:hypothetical protein